MIKPMRDQYQNYVDYKQYLQDKKEFESQGIQKAKIIT